MLQGVKEVSSKAGEVSPPWKHSVWLHHQGKGSGSGRGRGLLGKWKDRERIREGKVGKVLRGQEGAGRAGMDRDEDVGWERNVDMKSKCQDLAHT